MTTTKTKTPAPELDLVGQPESRSRRSGPIRRKLLGGVCGVTALAAVAVTAFAGSDSNEPASSRRGGQPQIEVQQGQGAETQQPQTAEVFGGCLNDAECYGEPSQLPANYWERSADAAFD